MAARQGYYHDAICNKGNTVLALISEDSGGVTAVVTALLRRLAKKTTVDNTRYGAQSSRNFEAHHATAISFAITTGAAKAIVNEISKLETRLADGEGRSSAAGG